jgi:hypothetical protein
MPSPPLSFSLFFLRATTLRSRGYWTRKVVRVEGKKNRTAMEFDSDRKRGSCGTVAVLLCFLFFIFLNFYFLYCFGFGRYIRCLLFQTCVKLFTESKDFLRDLDQSCIELLIESMVLTI